MYIHVLCRTGYSSLIPSRSKNTLAIGLKYNVNHKDHLYIHVHVYLFKIFKNDR